MKKSPIKFNLYNVVNTTTGKKATVWYSLDNRADQRKCVTIYSKAYGYGLGEVFSDAAAYENDTDSMTDYFDKGRVRIFETDAIYSVARAAVEKIIATLDEKRAQRAAQREARRTSQRNARLAGLVS